MLLRIRLSQVYILLLAVFALSSSSVSSVRGDGLTEKAAKLSECLRAASQPGEVTQEQKKELENLLRFVLPEIKGELAGYRWDVEYIDSESRNFYFLVNLRPTGGNSWDRDMWFHIFYEPSPDEHRVKHYGNEDFEGYRGMGATDMHFFVLVGHVEIRAVAMSDKFKNDKKIRDVLRAFKLKVIEKL